jgi:hypothetical protein
MVDIDKIDIIFHIFVQLYSLRVAHSEVKLNTNVNHFKSFLVHAKLILLGQRKNEYWKHNYETNILGNREI